jgi:hypothetical protein
MQGGFAAILTTNHCLLSTSYCGEAAYFTVIIGLVSLNK